MAVVNLKSAYITNRDATPRVLNDSAAVDGKLRSASAVITITSGDNIGSKYALFELPSNAVVKSLRVSAPDIGTTTTFDVGLYETTRNGGAVVAANFFRAALAVNAGAQTKTECAFSNIITFANALSRLWQLVPGSLTRDPVKKYDVVLTLTGTADGTGAVLVECDYVE